MNFQKIIFIHSCLLVSSFIYSSEQQYKNQSTQTTNPALPTIIEECDEIVDTVLDTLFKRYATVIEDQMPQRKGFSLTPKVERPSTNQAENDYADRFPMDR